MSLQFSQWAKSMLVLLAAVFIGCAKSEYEWEGLPTFPAAGRVLIRGAPQPGVEVVFHPLDELQEGRPRGVTDDQGRFRLRTYQADDGAPAGDYAVTLYWPAPRTADEEANNELPPPDQLGGRFAKPEISGLRATIDEQPVDLDAFEVE